MTPQEMWPLSTGLGLSPVEKRVETEPNKFDGAFIGSHPSFDIDEVEAKLGPERFAALSSGLKRVASIRHRVWPQDHPEPHKRGSEVHSVYADDLEAFLKAGG